MRLSTFPILAACALSLTGCGKFFDKFSRLGSKDFTVLSVTADRSGQRSGVIGFQDPIHSLVNVLNGGAIIYAKNTGSGEVYSLSVAHENVAPDQKVLIVPKGDYEFYGVGWEQSGLTTAPTTTARVRCGLGPAKTLSTDADDIVINLADLDECHDNSFFTPVIARDADTDKTIRNLSLVFCNKDNLSDRTADSNTSSNHCKGDLSSSAFFKGDPNYIKMERAEYVNVAGSEALVYMATHFDDGPTGSPNEPYLLYKYDFNTGRQSRVSTGATFNGGAEGVKSIKKVPGKRMVLFTLHRGSTDPLELWVYNLNTGNVQKISNHGTNTGTNGTMEFRVSPDGNYVVYVSDKDATADYELFSVAIGADTTDSYGTPQAIGGTFAPGRSVYKCPSCGGENQFAFEISSNSKFVFFSADKDSADVYDMYLATTSGANFDGTLQGVGPTTGHVSGIRISNSGEVASANDLIDEIDFSYDDGYLVYHVQASGTNKIYQRTVTLTATTATVAAASQLATGVKHPFYQLGESSNMMVYFTDDGTDITTHRIDLDGTDDFILFDEGVSNTNAGGVSQVKLVSSDATVIVALHDGTRVKSIRSAPTAVANDYGDTDAGGPDPGAPWGDSVSYTGGILPATQEVKPLSADHSGLYNHKFVQNETGDKILFIADRDTAGNAELYEATIGTAVPTKVSGNVVNDPDKSIKNATYHGDNIFFTYDSSGTATTDQRLYQANTGGYDSPLVQGSNSYFTNIVGISDNEEDDFGSGLPVMGVPLNAAGSSPEIWIFDPGSTSSASDNTYDRISHLVGATAGGDPSGNDRGLGRVRIRMMEDPYGTGAQTAFSSPCISLSNSSSIYDGEVISTSVRIPAGNGSTSVFHTVVDVFPLATDCNGTPDTYEFSKGLYGGGAGVNSKLASDAAGYYTLFIDTN